MTGETLNTTSEKRPKTLRYWVLLFILILFALYTGAWYWYAGNLKNEISSALADFKEQDIIFEKTPEVTGFPLLHKIFYKGKIITRTAIFTVPTLEISGITFPQRPITVHFPQGFAWTGPVQTSSYTLDELFIKIGLPPELPDNVTLEKIRNWNKQNPQLNIYKFELKKAPLVLTAQGKFELDNELQPTGEIVFKSRGHNKLMENLKADGTLRNQDTSFIQTLLSGFTKSDENGEQFLHIALEIKDSALFFGPLRVGPVPRINWTNDTDDIYETE